MICKNLVELIPRLNEFKQWSGANKIRKVQFAQLKARNYFENLGAYCQNQVFGYERPLRAISSSLNLTVDN